MPMAPISSETRSARASPMRALADRDVRRLDAPDAALPDVDLVGLARTATPPCVTVSDRASTFSAPPWSISMRSARQDAVVRAGTAVAAMPPAGP